MKTSGAAAPDFAHKVDFFVESEVWADPKPTDPRTMSSIRYVAALVLRNICKMSSIIRSCVQPLNTCFTLGHCCSALARGCAATCASRGMSWCGCLHSTLLPSACVMLMADCSHRHAFWLTPPRICRTRDHLRFACMQSNTCDVTKSKFLGNHSTHRVWRTHISRKK
jgi:hypothetical protein